MTPKLFGFVAKMFERTGQDSRIYKDREHQNMAYTIDYDDGCVTAEELHLMKTKHAILEKLRDRFGDYEDRQGWPAGPAPDPEGFSGQRASRQR